VGLIWLVDIRQLSKPNSLAGFLRIIMSMSASDTPRIARNGRDGDDVRA
jgi:hypothetical protein